MTRLVWVSSTMAPIWVLGSSGSPGIIFWPIAMTFSRNASLILSSTIRREPAVQTSPWLNKMPKAVRRRGDVEVGRVGQHDVGRLAAALQPDLLHVRFAGVAQEVLADLGRAGEGDARRRPCGGRAPGRRSRRSPAATLNTPSGMPASAASSAEADGGERRLLGGLQDHRVAGGQRRRDLPARHQQREVPRHDGGDHARAARG